MIGNGFYPPTYLDLEVCILLLKGDNVPLQDIYLISQVDLLVVKFFDRHAAVDGGFQDFYL
jgi:hypothetical protein